MAPVFTAYNSDGTVNLDIIDDYAKSLTVRGVKAVLVNGTTGEGMLLNLEERKQVAEKWKQACIGNNITLMIQVGGAPYPDVIELARHAEQLNVDGILCLPELYFKPKTPEALVEYLQHVALHCPNTPFFYYHIPMFTDVNINMPIFLDLAEQSIPNFRGIKYTSGDLEQGTACLKAGRIIFLGADSILCGALAAGFDSFIMTTLNICPEISAKIIAQMGEGNVDAARDAQRELNARIKQILKKGDWVTAMKKEFNERQDILLGHTRPPLCYF